ncbi:MAG: hypothetical protein KDB22_23650 [Planctomycetales bacterium]|nr:hypothetical protein [Planctomycetales bacterium]
MQPLTPRDLLIRTEPADVAAIGGEENAREQFPTVTLERFQALEHVIRAVPINAEPYLELARIYHAASRWVDARRILDLAYARFSDNEEVCFLREEVQLARSLQLFGEAKLEYEQEPTAITKASLERCKVELNVLRETVCRARLERHPDQVDLNIPLAIALDNLGNSEEAVEKLKSAAQHPRLRAAASLQMGFVLQRLKRIPEALSAFRRAALFRVPPPAADIKLQALQAAAELAQKSGMVDSARRYFQMLCDLKPDEQRYREQFELLKDQPL